MSIAALIEAVEAGEPLSGNEEFWAAMNAAFPRQGGVVSDVAKAYHGSLDAAMALHEALLPECSQYSIVTDPTCLCVKVAWWPNGLSGGTCHQGEAWHEGDPARAWLLAILRAKEASQ